MHMTFWWDVNVGNFLFPGLEVKTKITFTLVCLTLTVLTFLFEWLKLLQATHRQKVLLLRSKQIRTVCPSESSTLLNGEHTNTRNVLNISLKQRILLHIWEGFLCLSLQNLSYILMLAVMLYNAWFLISILIGGGLGHFVFGQIFMKINLNNCQVMRETFCSLKCEEQDAINTTPPNSDDDSCITDVNEIVAVPNLPNNAKNYSTSS